jgi:hypothetical protein
MSFSDDIQTQSRELSSTPIALPPSQFATNQRVDPEPRLPQHRLEITKDDKYYIWTQTTNKPFFDWWETTAWYSNNPSRTLNRKVPLIGSKKSAWAWESYREVADRILGTPMIQCIRCDIYKEHPSSKSSGSTTSMTAHLGTDSCKKAWRRLNLLPGTQLTLRTSISTSNTLRVSDIITLRCIYHFYNYMTELVTTVTTLKANLISTGTRSTGL